MGSDEVWNAQHEYQLLQKKLAEAESIKESALRRIDEAIVTVEFYKNRFDDDVYRELMSSLQDHWPDESGRDVRSKLHQKIEALAGAVLVGATQNDVLVTANREASRADMAEQMVCELRSALADIARPEADGPTTPATLWMERRALAALSLAEPVAGRWVSRAEHERILDRVADAMGAIARARRAEAEQRFSWSTAAQAERARDLAEERVNLANMLVSALEREQERSGEALKMLGPTRDMLREAIDVFQKYAAHHREKGATEKADRNQELADRFQSFLYSGPGES